jgi:hypothetical protein
MAAGVHQTQPRGGVLQTRALLNRQSIHVRPHRHQRAPERTELRHHAGAPHPLTHLPAPAPQLPGHQGGGLLLMAAELGMAVEVAAQLDQLRQDGLQPLLKPRAAPVEGGHGGTIEAGAQGGGGHRRDAAGDAGARARNWARA